MNQLNIDLPLISWFEFNYSELASEQTRAKNNKIKTIFKEDGWNILNPRGNGLCMFYACMFGLERSDFSQDDINLILIKGIRKYFTINYQETDFFIEKSNQNRIMFYPNYTDIEIINNFNLLLDDNNTCIRFAQILMYALEINILILSYDSKSENPYTMQLFDLQPQVDIFEGHMFERLVPTIILLNDSGHYFLISHTNANNKNIKIKEILSNKLWL